MVMDGYLKMFGNYRGKKYTIPRGVIPAIEEIYPNATGRFCARHIYANFRAKWPGGQFKTLFWAVARATNYRFFTKEMENIKTLDKDAHAYLAKLTPSLWSLHAFDHIVKVDHVTNNFTESFNGWLAPQRGKPIIVLMEFIRRKLMTRMQRRYERGLSWEGNVTKRVSDKIVQISRYSRFCTVAIVGLATDFEVIEDGVGYVGNLNQMVCNCGEWQVSGIPCKHAMAAILYKRLNPQDFVHTFFYKDTYMNTYKHMIKPMPNQSMWPEHEYGTILPPELRRRPGRPVKLRRRERGEARPAGVRRTGSLKCRKCKQYGHNARTCGGPPLAGGRVTAKGGTRGGREGRGSTNNQIVEVGSGDAMPSNQTRGRRGTRGGRGGTVGTQGTQGEYVSQVTQT